MKKPLMIFLMLLSVAMLCSCEEDIPDIPQVGEFTTGAYVAEAPEVEKLSVRDALYEQEHYYAELGYEMYYSDKHYIYGDYGGKERLIDKIFREKLNMDVLQRAGYEFDEGELEYKARLEKYLEDKKMTYYIPTLVVNLERGIYEDNWCITLLAKVKDNSDFLDGDSELEDLFKFAFMQKYAHSSQNMLSRLIDNTGNYSREGYGFSEIGEPLTYKVYYDEERAKTVIELSRKADVIISYHGSAMYDSKYMLYGINEVYLPASYNNLVSIGEVAEYGYVQNFASLSIKSNIESKSPIEFQNSKLEKAVREHLKKGEDEPIYIKELIPITSLTFYKDYVIVNGSMYSLPQEVLADNRVVDCGEFSFEDIKYFQSLNSITVSNINIEEMDLFWLHMQKCVIINNCNSKRIVGCEGTMIKEIRIIDCEISDVSPIRELVGADIVTLSGSAIKSIDLPSAVRGLHLINLDIFDISFVNDLQSLETLKIENCANLDLSQINSSVWESVITVRLPAGTDHEFLLEYENIRSLYVGDEKIK